MRKTLVMIGALLKDAGCGYQEHNVGRMAAAMAFYGTLSLAPMLVIMVTAAGYWFGEDAARGLIADRLRGTLGEENARFIQSTLARTYESKGGVLATGLAIAILVISASRVVGGMRDALNDIWGARAQGGSGPKRFLLNKLFDIGMVLGIGLVFLGTMSVNIAASGATRRLSDTLHLSGWAVQGFGMLFSFLVVTVFLTVVFGIFPNVRRPLLDILAGATVTAVLFSVGNYLIGLYLGRSSPGSVFGAAGSLAAIMIWIYCSALIVLFGAELTRAFSLGKMATDRHGG